MINVPGIILGERLAGDDLSAVYRGTRREDGKRVIVKVLTAEYPSLRDIARMHHEHSVARRLGEHPNIVGVVALLTAGNGYALLMEDFGGVALSDMLRQGRLSLHRSLQLAIQLVDAISWMHERNVVHKDIKPGNIIVDVASLTAKLSDFGIALSMGEDSESVMAPGDTLEGTPAYMSPEQTGRTHAPVDYRSDFYAFGVTLYEMLTGALPFDEAEPAALMAAHAAKAPVSPRQRDANLPRSLERLLLKCLAKAPADRYQSGHGIKHDLLRAQQELAARGAIDDFEVGLADTSAKLRFTDELVGRETELHALGAGLARVMRGTSECIVISGEAGIGKSQLGIGLQELAVQQGAWFGASRYSSAVNRTPYTGIVQICRGWLREILLSDSAVVEKWKQTLAPAIDEGAQLLCTLLPEIGLILGTLPPNRELPSLEAQRRFTSAFRGLLRCMSQKRPVVMFLDDLQWADPGSLQLIGKLLEPPAIAGLMIVTAARDAEGTKDAFQSDAFLQTLLAGGVTVSSLKPLPLGRAAVQKIVSDALRDKSSEVADLGRIIAEKTHGNPFFVRHLMDDLCRQKLLAFNPEMGRWTWNSARVVAAPVTDNVVERLSDKLRLATPQAVRTLELAACIGYDFDLKTLAALGGADVESRLDDIWEGVKHGLVLPVGEDQGDARAATKFRFAHERVQRTVYTSLSISRRQELHLSIAKLLIGADDSMPPGDLLFVVANHLQHAHDLLTAHDKRQRWCSLLSAAGARAKSAGAFEEARNYLEGARQLLDESAWAAQRHDAFATEMDYGDCLHALGEHEMAIALFDGLLRRSATAMERAAVFAAQMGVFISLTQHEKCIGVGLAALANIGLHTPRKPSTWSTMWAFFRGCLLFALGRRSIEALENLPRATDPVQEMRLATLIHIAIAANNVNNVSLYAWSTLKTFELTLRYGATDVSPIGYLGFGLALSSGLNLIQPGVRFARLALRGLSRAHSDALRAMTEVAHHFMMWHWQSPVGEIFAALDEAQQHARLGGTSTWAIYACFNRVLSLLYCGVPLQRLKLAIHQALELARDLQYTDIDAFKEYERFAAAMSGDNADAAYASAPEPRPQFYDSVGRFRELLRMQYLNYMGEYGAAAAIAERNHTAMDGLRVALPFVEHTFHYALALAAGTQDGGWRRLRHRRRLVQLAARLASWAEAQPSNFASKAYMIRGECARLRGDHRAALGAYDAAVAAGEEQGLVQDVALANELAARACLTQGNDRLAKLYMTEARYYYRRWGAGAKVQQLAAVYPELIYTAEVGTQGAEELSGLIARAGQGLAVIDLDATLSSAQQLAAEMDMGALLSKLARVSVESTSAERGCVVLRRDDNAWIIRAIAAEGTSNMSDMGNMLLESYPDVPASVIEYVGRTGETLVLNQPASEGMFRQDAYIQRTRPKSIICAPLVQNSAPTGVVYLENNLLPVVGESRLEVLRYLLAQGAVSLENARLYSALSVQHRERLAELKQMQSQMLSLDKESVERRMAGGFAHEIRNALAGSQLLLGKCAGNLGGRDDKSLWDQTSDDLATLLKRLQDWLPGEKFQGLTSYAKTILTNEQKVAEVVTQVMKENQRALGITQQIMEYARAEEGKIAGINTVEVNSVLRKLVEQTRGEFARDAIEVTLSASGQEHIEGSEMEVLSIVRNLLHNARDAVMEAAGKAHVIEVESTAGDRDVVIRVKDNGGGIAAEHLPHMFDAFYRVRPAAGPGLGLSMVKKIVTMYGGDVDVQSHPGESSVFTVRLPRRRRPT